MKMFLEDLESIGASNEDNTSPNPNAIDDRINELNNLSVYESKDLNYFENTLP